MAVIKSSRTSNIPKCGVRPKCIPGRGFVVQMRWNVDDDGEDLPKEPFTRALRWSCHCYINYGKSRNLGLLVVVLRRWIIVI